MFPADQVVFPFSRSVAELPTDTGPAIVDAACEPTVSVLPPIVSVPVRFRLPTAASAVEIDGEPPMTASSLDVGTPDGLQLAAVSQLPEPPTHVFVSAVAVPAENEHHIAMTSVAHTTRRKPLRPCTGRSSPRRWIDVNYTGVERSGSSSKSSRTASK